MSREAPAVFLGTAIPDAIRSNWHRWEGAEWRSFQHMGTNNPFPPDQRFGVRRPEGMCPAHGQHWLDYRNMRFNSETGDRWPGGAGSPFIVLGQDLNRVREERRIEWDRKASEQMQLIERICLSGRSPQCDRPAPVAVTRVIAAERIADQIAAS